MVAAAKAAVPTVGDQAAALQLGNFAKATASALAELRAASTKVGSCFSPCTVEIKKTFPKSFTVHRSSVSDGTAFLRFRFPFLRSNAVQRLNGERFWKRFFDLYCIFTSSLRPMYLQCDTLILPTIHMATSDTATIPVSQVSPITTLPPPAGG